MCLWWISRVFGRQCKSESCGVCSFSNPIIKEQMNLFLYSERHRGDRRRHSPQPKKHRQRPLTLRTSQWSCLEGKSEGNGKEIALAKLLKWHMEFWQQDKPGVKEGPFLALLLWQVEADTNKSDLRRWESCLLLEMGIRARGIIGKLWRIIIAGYHYDTLWKGAKVGFRPAVSAAACRLYTGWNRKFVQAAVELIKSGEKRLKTKSERWNKNKTPAEADDKWSHQRQMLENLGSRCSRLLLLRRGRMMHLWYVAPALA